MGSKTVGTRPKPLQDHCRNLLPSCSKHRPTDLFKLSLQQSSHIQRIFSQGLSASVAEVLPYVPVAVITFCPAIRVEYGSGCFTGGAAVIIHNAHPSSVFCIHDSDSKRTRRITDVESIRFTTHSVAIEQPNTCSSFILLLAELDTRAEQSHQRKQ